MSSIDITMTGAAGWAPMPAALVDPCGGVRTAPAAAPAQGMGLSVAAYRLRGSAVPGFAGTALGARRPLPPVIDVPSERVMTAHLITAHIKSQHTTTNTPGDLPPRDPLG